jgi:hypothetical protein
MNGANGMKDGAKKLKIYWNNICLLRKAEEGFINGYAAEAHGADIDVEYFGLGMPKKLRTQIAGDLAAHGDVGADVIVSTELDIFWDARLLRGKDFFTDTANGFEVRDTVAAFIDPDRTLAAAHLLPMLISVNGRVLGDLPAPRTLEDLCSAAYKGKIVLGGADTAAGRSIVICIWYLYGEAAARRFLDNATFVNLPAMAYGAAIKGEYPVCLLPSVLSGRGLDTVFPADGAPTIPTYACVRKSADKAEAYAFLGLLFGKSMQTFYADRGFIIPSNNEVDLSPAFYSAPPALLYPDWTWLNAFDTPRFSALMDGITPVR